MHRVVKVHVYFHILHERSILRDFIYHHRMGILRGCHTHVAYNSFPDIDELLITTFISTYYTNTTLLLV